MGSGESRRFAIGRVQSFLGCDVGKANCKVSSSSCCCSQWWVTKPLMDLNSNGSSLCLCVCVWGGSTPMKARYWVGAWWISLKISLKWKLDFGFMYWTYISIDTSEQIIIVSFSNNVIKHIPSTFVEWRCSNWSCGGCRRLRFGWRGFIQGKHECNLWWMCSRTCACR